MNITFLAAAGGLGDLVNQTAESFGFDVRIFLSQIISFVIVALLLKRFAYKPILAVLEERRQRIAEGLLNADKIKQQLAEAEQRYQEILAKGNGEAQKNDRRSAGERRRDRGAQSSRKRLRPRSKSSPRRAKPACSSTNAP